MKKDLVMHGQMHDISAGQETFVKTPRAMSYDAWVDRFQPQRNTVNAEAPFEGTMYETFGEEVEAAWTHHQEHSGTVWTLLDCDGRLYIVAGWHRVNRLGYFVCAVPFVNAHEQRDVRVG